MVGAIPAGCGQCFPCRINRRRVWTHRLMLESLVHGDSTFGTLTYAPEHLPAGGNLVPEHLRNFLKRLRFEISPRRLRFYAVGEYGDKSWRPHYHLALFGVSIAETEMVRRVWGFGHVMLGDLTTSSAQYIAGYVTKKMTNSKDSRLSGRHPEFARMSLKPGIGALSIGQVAAVLKSPFGQEEVQALGDVPHSLKVGSKAMPLGRYLRRKLREALGRSPDTPEEVILRYAQEMHDLFESEKVNEADKAYPSSFNDKKSVYQRMNKQRYRNVDSKAKIFDPKRSL